MTQEATPWLGYITQGASISLAVRIGPWEQHGKDPGAAYFMGDPYSGQLETSNQTKKKEIVGQGESFYWVTTFFMDIRNTGDEPTSYRVCVVY